jgi:hypothetical protein
MKEEDSTTIKEQESEQELIKSMCPTCKMPAKYLFHKMKANDFTSRPYVGFRCSCIYEVMRRK